MYKKAFLLLIIFWITGVFSVSAESSDDIFLFYSKIDDSYESQTKNLVKTRLDEYRRFAGFGNECRKPLPWLDNESMNIGILEEIKQGNLGSILAIAKRKKITLDSASLTNLANCFKSSYEDMATKARNDMGAYEKVASMGVYMDGDTSNSDYDILTDIQKINGVIFTETLSYNGVRNSAKGNLTDFLAGKWMPQILGFGNESGPIGSGSGNPNGSGSSTETGSFTPGELGIGEICTKPNAIRTVDTMMDDSFLTELAVILSGDTSDSASVGTTYENRRNNEGNSGSLLPKTSANDFYNTPRCASGDIEFCITFGTNAGMTNLLGGSKTRSIEGILDIHTPIMDAISWTNLSSQKMSRNNFQLTWKDIKFKNLIPKQMVYISKEPQFQDTYKTDVTQKSEAEKLEMMKKCADISAGVSENTNGAGFMQKLGSTSLTQANNSITIGPVDAEEKAKLGCLNLYLEEGRKEGYKSFSNDLTQIQLFTSALIDEIKDLLSNGIALDSKPAS